MGEQLEAVAERIVAALEADARRTERGGDRAYHAKAWTGRREDDVRVYVYEGCDREDCGYIAVDADGEHDYRPIRKGRAAVRDAVGRGLALLGEAQS